MKHDQFIAVEGLSMILPLAGATLLALVAGFRGLGLVLLLLTLFVLWFFRNPQRKTPEKEKLVISPADGKVIRIDDGRYKPQEFLKLNGPSASRSSNLLRERCRISQ